MEKLRKFKSITSSVLSSTFMFISFLFGSRFGLTGALLSFVLGIVASIGLAEYCSRKIVSSKKLRMFLNRPYFIEGYWRIVTNKTAYDFDYPDNISIKLTKCGVMLVEYNYDTDKHSVVVSRLDKDGNIFTTKSEYCYMTEGNNSIKYLNYFEIMDADTVTMCICDGDFLRRHMNSHSVDSFSSRLYVEGEAPRRTQHAVPLDESEYENFRSQGKDWQEAFLRDWEQNPEAHKRKNPSMQI